MMNTTTERALTALRLADPASDDQASEAGLQTAVLDRILADSGAPEAVTERHARGRRLALGSALAATTAAVIVAGTLPMPWSHGHKTSEAWAIETRADGALDVTIRFDDLRNPGALNEALQERGARTVVTALSAPGECTSPVPGDPNHPPALRVSVEAGQDPKDAIRAAQLEQEPWLTHDRASEATSLFTIHPDLIPAGDQILIMYTWMSPQGPDGTSGDALGTSTMLVPHVPPCVPAIEDQVRNADGIGVR